MTLVRTPESGPPPRTGVVRGGVGWREQRVAHMAVRFENSQPILRVENMEASLRFYVGKLGFRNAEWGDADFTCVTCDQACIYLCCQGQGRGGAWVWIGVEDAKQLHDELRVRGVAIRMPLTNHAWALEFQVEDPDGNVLRFGSESKPFRH